MTSASLHVIGLTKRYGRFVALAPTDLVVPAGEFLTLLGPSGSGKTTLLSVIAGLVHPNEGEVRLGSIDVTYHPPYERDIGMVFQNYALFPHMTVEDNVAFPLRMRKVSAADTTKRAAEALEMVRLPHVGKRFPRELSGGQQQRIALARCLVYRPSVILMDEPLGALDKKLREQMQLEIKRIHRELRTTIIYVTHDQEEAMTMSDRICLMSNGAIEQLGTPHDLYFRPRTLFVADFLGESNLLPAAIASATADGLDIAIDGVIAPVRSIGNGAMFHPLQRVTAMVRPQNLEILPGDAPNGRLKARVTDVMVSGSLTKLYLEPLVAGPPPLVAAYPTRAGGAVHEVGDVLSVAWRCYDVVVIPETAGA